MPTATSTLTMTTATTTTPPPLKQSQAITLSSTEPPSSSATTTTTLRTLYNRAARAFLHRDVPLTESLLSSAFTLLQPPSSLPDPLTAHRRKWDILRITLETTIYTSPPKSHDVLPPTLRTVLLQSQHALITSLYTRSLKFFTPTSTTLTQPNPGFLPSQVLITLVYSSLKLGCTDVGRVMIEDWLARREYPDSLTPSDSDDGDGYEKVLELYCLQILPQLEQWDYANEFLEYERELVHETRERFKSSLSALHAQTLSSRIRAQSPPSQSSSPSTSQFLQTPPSSRPYSPAPSSSSTSSSLSTTSNHTAVPSTPRPTRPSQIHFLSSLSSLTTLQPASLSTTSLDSNSTATPAVNPPTKNSRPKSGSRPPQGTSNRISSPTPLSLPRSNSQEATLRPLIPNTYALLKASLAPYLTTPNLTTILLIFVVFPIISFLLRLRRRRALASGAATPLVGAAIMSNNNAELVRRRLQAVSGREAGVLRRVWREVFKAVADTVRMGGSGLV